MNSNEMEFKIGDYTFSYSIVKDIVGSEVVLKILITGNKGTGGVIELPDYIGVDGDKLPVAIIGKKAFLGCMSLRRIILPSTIEVIEDWAFAQCDRLETFILLGKNSESETDIDNLSNVKIGKGVFDDCNSIKDICLGQSEKNCLSALLGAVPHRLEAEYLLLDSEIGSDEWYEKWDSKLVSFLDEDDDEGYTNLVLCGEEDIQRSEPGFISDKKKRKAALCLLRLKNCNGLSSELESRIKNYLLLHKKGSESDEAWKVILNEYGDDLSYYKLFAEIGGITKDNVDDMLKDMGERHVEAKAYLLNFKREQTGTADIFDSFVL